MKHSETEKNLKVMAKRYLGSDDLFQHQENQRLEQVEAEIVIVLQSRYQALHHQAKNPLNLDEIAGRLSEGNEAVGFASGIHGVFKFFSIAISAMIALVNGAAGLIITGLTALKEVFTPSEDEAQRKTRIIAVGTCCLAVIGLLILFGVLAISVFALPAVLAGLMGLTIYKEAVIRMESIKLAQKIEEEIKKEEEELSERVEFVINNNPKAKNARQELIAQQRLMQEEHSSPERLEQLKENVDRAKANLAKTLYTDDKINSHSKSIDAKKREFLALKVKAKYANRRKKATIFGLLGVAVAIMGVFFPLVAVVGIGMMAASSYKYQESTDQEAAELKALAALGEEKPPLIVQLDHLSLIEHKLREKEQLKYNLKESDHVVPVDAAKSQAHPVSSTTTPHENKEKHNIEKPLTPEETTALNNFSSFHHDIHHPHHSHFPPLPSHAHPETLTAAETEALNTLSAFHHVSHLEPKLNTSDQPMDSSPHS